MAKVKRVGGWNELTSSSLASLPRVDAASALSEADAKRFAEDGAIVLRQVCAPEWVELMRAAAEVNLSNPGPLCDEHAEAQGTKGRFHDDQFLWRRHSVFEEWVLRSGIGSLAARAMGSSTAHKITLSLDSELSVPLGTTA